MKKIIFIVVLVIILLFVLYNFTPVFAPLKETILYTKYVSDNGFLHVDGTSIKNNKNNDFELMGLSSHGLQWYNQLLTYDNLKTLKDTWEINVFRIAMYTDENGYINNKDEMKQKLIEITNNLIDLDMYVIIDWHTLKDNDPNKYKEDAKVFFDEISTLYKDSPNIIYEICNEPSGNTVTWDDQIKPYAEEIIPIIRKNAPKSLIIVGTPNWCKDLTSPSNNKLNYENILYSCHFYAGTHKQELRDEIDKALQNNLPVIVSEWGTTDASGNGSVDIEESKKWIEYLNSKKISHINWSFSNKNESSAIIRQDYLENPDNNDTSNNEDNLKNDFNDYLTESGKFVKSIFN